MHVKPQPSGFLLLYTMFPKLPYFHVKIPKNTHKKIKADFIWKNRATSNSLERRSVSKTLPPNGALPHGSPFNSLREAETNLWQRLGAPQQKFFWASCCWRLWNTFLSWAWGAQVFTRWFDGKFYWNLQKMTMDWRRACCKNVWLRGFNTELNRNSDLTKFWWWLRFLRKTEISWNYHSLRYLVQEYWTWLWNGW